MENSAQSSSVAATELRQLTPGKLPFDVFSEVARLTVTPVVELVPFWRNEQGELRVYLLQRDSEDPVWPGLYHVPGTIVLASDQAGTFSDALTRITYSKLVDFAPTAPTYVFTQLCETKRGSEVAIVFFTELQQSPATAALFDPRSLPSSMIEGQADFITQALNAGT